MFSVYAVSNYAVLHLCGTRKWSKFLLYAAIFSHYAVFVQKLGNKKRINGELSVDLSFRGSKYMSKVKAN